MTTKHFIQPNIIATQVPIAIIAILIIIII